MLPGFATPEGTARYASRMAAVPGHFRTARGLTLSSLGLGSYLGPADSAGRAGYVAATQAALQGGVNVLDTAANYRDQASERDLGAGLRAYMTEGGARDEVVVATKVGFIHGDCDEADSDAWFDGEYLSGGPRLAAGDVRSGHSLAPRFVRHEIARSRANLGLECLDIVYLHNPEHALEWGATPSALYAAVEEAFVVLEEAVDAGHIRMYGVATWDGLRCEPGARGHLQLVKLVHHAGAARMRVGGKAGDHHFRAVQLPVNLALTEAVLVPTQPFRFGAQTALHCAQDLDMLVFASASLMQMRLAGRIPTEMHDALGTTTDAQTLLQFTRSIPGITTALVGMGNPEHARQNTQFARTTPPAPGIVKTLLGTGSLHGA